MTGWMKLNVAFSRISDARVCATACCLVESTCDANERRAADHYRAPADINIHYSP